MQRSVLIYAGAVLLAVALFLMATQWSPDTLQNSADTNDANVVAVTGKPKIWYCDRVLVVERANAKIPESVLNAFLSPDANLQALGVPARPLSVEYSCRPDVGRCFYGGKVCFSHAVAGDGWRVQWGMYYCGTEKPVESNCAKPKSCGVYFTGIGCPHCALTDPWLFYEFVPKHPIVVVEYEIYRDASANGPVFEKYAREYNTVFGVPQIIFDENHIIVGDLPMIRELNAVVGEVKGCSVSWLKK